MTSERDTSGPVRSPRPFCVVLTPRRSLSRTGFIVLMSAVGIVSFVTGLAFTLIGAWPVLGFFGLDVALIWLAFRLNYRSGRQLEKLEIDAGVLRLTHVDSHGRSHYTELAALWVDVRLRQAANGHTALALASHGQEHPFAAFLTDAERRELAPLLRAALVDARGGPRI